MLLTYVRFPGEKEDGGMIVSSAAHSLCHYNTKHSPRESVRKHLHLSSAAPAHWEDISFSGCSHENVKINKYWCLLLYHSSKGGYMLDVTTQKFTAMVRVSSNIKYWKEHFYNLLKTLVVLCIIHWRHSCQHDTANKGNILAKRFPLIWSMYLLWR